MKYLPHGVAFGKMQAMVQGADIVGQEQRDNLTSGGLNLGPIPAKWSPNKKDGTVQYRWNRCKANKGRTR
jgi:hypothetical protein